MTKNTPLPSRLLAEFIGSMFLVMAAISPIILFREILGAPLAIAVLADAIAVAFVLYALIDMFEMVSYAHFNPAVTLAMYIDKRIEGFTSLFYIMFQVLGGIAGVLASHLMFFDRIGILVDISSVSRPGGNYFAEVLGTFFLILAIFLLVEKGTERISFTIGALVGGMLLTTSSTMFANPQVTIARMFTYCDAGISPFDAVIFIAMEVIGAMLAVMAFRVLNRKIN